MLETDYTIEWTLKRQATITWEGGVSEAVWSIFINGRLASVASGSGTMAESVSVDERGVHSIAIVKHASVDDIVVSPEAAPLLRPLIRWQAVANASDYEVKRVFSDDSEFLLKRVKVPDNDETRIFEWRPGSPMSFTGADSLRIKVYARSSWGQAVLAKASIGFVAGHPAPPRTITAAVNGPDMELSIAT